MGGLKSMLDVHMKGCMPWHHSHPTRLHCLALAAGHTDGMATVGHSDLYQLTALDLGGLLCPATQGAA